MSNIRVKGLCTRQQGRVYSGNRGTIALYIHIEGTRGTNSWFKSGIRLGIESQGLETSQENDSWPLA